MPVHLMPRCARKPSAAVIVATAFAAGAFAVGAFAAPAMADTSSIMIASATATPEQAIPVDLTFSGTNAQTGNAGVEAIVRPAGGLSCLSSYQEDTSTLPGQDVTIFAPGAQSVAPGAYSVSGSFKPPAPGLTRATASHRHGASVAGSTATGFIGKLAVSAACGRSTARHTAIPRHGRFASSFRLPSGCGRAARVKFTVSWAGSSAFAKQAVTRTVAIAR